MKQKNTRVAALACAALFGSAALSQAAIIIQDTFSYPDGGLGFNSGGTGWGSNVWFAANSSVAGGVAVGGGDSASKRNFAENLGTSVGPTATIWVRFDWGHSATVGAGSGYGGLTFYNGTSDGGSELFLIGNPWWGAATDGEWNISGGTGDNFTGVSSAGMKSGVAKMDLGAGTVSPLSLPGMAQRRRALLRKLCLWRGNPRAGRGYWVSASRPDFSTQTQFDRATP